ncbi:Putative uncharacterized protein [Taphrina deformans PYCC 5710]|uniref:Mitotic checkpoint protein BUB3 n=1 Tax=Taphrina deformans (strain PYCC 5710 / ATCC 11124 / CBS 356.35 / IMI 108563 / JCM 9778 / NBRC 8474) TaxID=1097556 RepID=R4XFN5_TAPDE|nr:Putative uncharacterized protein [Taphrina deformans PYCC 5710]|eukprot:CCG82162.1 Putative uncharacterized protein [Taphrina deformans PYCC 5710]
MSQTLVELSGPEDTISALIFSINNPVYLLASSWDGHLRLYDVTNKVLVRDFSERAPILDATFISETTVASASVDGALRLYDLEHGRLVSEKTHHTGAISSITYSHKNKILVAGSWDCSLSVHNMSAENVGQTVRINLSEKVFALSSDGEHVVVAMANRQVYIFSFTQLLDALTTQNTNLKPMQRRESSLKFMTRTIQCTMTSDHSMAGYVSTSIEGRVSVEFMDPSQESQDRKYAFKCHRQRTRNAQGEDEDVVYPVNAIEFHPMYKTFASAGGDGVVSVWDLKAKKRVKQYAAIGEEIQTLAYSPDARFLAIGTGSLGSVDSLPGGKIYLRAMAEGEGKGKS